MSSSLVPKLSEVVVPVSGGQRYWDRQGEIIDNLEKEKRYEERKVYGAKALAITGVLLAYNFFLITAAIYEAGKGLVNLLEK
jgi:hypothetical protein